MVHYGDIKLLSGYDVDVPDVVCGGSPCQDLSVAGSRSGLAAERSGLFFEFIRVVKELREHDRSSGRTNEFCRPRYMVFENVPGLLSSPGGNRKGNDFQTVLTEVARIAEPKCPDVPLPKDGKWAKAGCIVGCGENGIPFSIAWRVHDAQFWGTTMYDGKGDIIWSGTPQRRKRIALVADFSGLSASEVLFVRKGSFGNPQTSEGEGQGSAGNTETGTGETGESG